MAEKTITAMILRRGAVEWTTLRDRKGAAEVVEQVTVPLELPPGAEYQSPEWAAELKKKAGRARGTLVLAVASDQALLRVANLPSTDAEELRGMAELQVDKFSPFPVENMAVSHDLLARTEAASRVLIAAVQRTHIEALRDLLGRAGLAPEHVDVEILGWWRLLKDAGRVAAQGRQILLVIDAQSTELIVAQDGDPVLFRALGSHQHLSPAESAQEIADEINYTLTSLESEWGLLDHGALQIWRGDAVPAEFLARLREACAAPAEDHLLADLAPLSEGLARRALYRTADALDLAPAEWRAALGARRLRLHLLVAAGSFLLLWLVLAAAGLIAFKLQTSRVTALRAEIKALQRQGDEVRQLQRQVRSLERYADRTFSALECLREVCDLLPPGIDLDQYNYKKYGSVNLRGEADVSDPIYDFFKALEKSKQFTAIKPEGVTSMNRNNRQRSQFKVTCLLPEEAP